MAAWEVIDMERACLVLLGIAMSVLAAPYAGVALTAEQLNALINRQEKITIIDIRSRSAYAESHIPGALNIPAQLCTTKPLPPMGRVVVYGDGIDHGLTTMALEALQAKPGIHPEILEGGFQRWEALHHPATRPRGMEKEKMRHVSYQELQQIALHNPDLVLIDLRPQALPDLDGVTALATAFPGVPQMALDQLQAQGGDHDKFYVLIDNGDGMADTVAKHLKAAGMRRLAVLAGGEMILRRQGQPGVGRQ